VGKIDETTLETSVVLQVQRRQRLARLQAVKALVEWEKTVLPEVLGSWEDVDSEGE
jgi:hypothetical protein